MEACLHAKSRFSLGYGTASVEELAARAARLGFGALALTDVENAYGAVRLHAACRELGLRPITGIELRAGFDAQHGTGEREGRIVLLARNRAGYESLCRIVSERRGARPARAAVRDDPVATACSHPDGLFVLSDDADALERALVGGIDRAALGVLIVRPTHGPGARELAAWAESRGVPLVASLDVVLLAREDHRLHELQLAVRRRETLDAIREAGIAEGAERVLVSAARMRALFTDVPRALAAARSIAERCELDLLAAAPVLPRMGADAAAEQAELARACREALAAGRARGRWRGAGYDERLARELLVVAESRFAGYLLLVAETVRFARERGIAVVGRGSAAGSLVCHVLGATAVDPLEHGLLFERFLHPGRLDLPDVDVDLSSARREEVIEHVRARFGRERVAMVSAMHALQRRSARREGLAALGVPAGEAEPLVQRWPREDASADERAATLPPRVREHLATIERLVGMPHHVAVHPGGVVVADRAIEAYAPLEIAPKGVVVTQYDLVSVERVGLVKLDLLGNRCLDQIERALALVHERASGAPPADARLDASWTPPADGPLLDLLGRAATVGVFQLETPAMRSLLAKVPVHELADCIAVLAAVRPGAAAGRAKSEWVRRARGEEPPSFPHPALASVLAETHGVPLYEEDLLRTVSAIAGVPLEEADRVRVRIQRAGDDERELAELEESFLASAERAGRSREEARPVWSVVRRFAAYSFSKAHAASYALLAWQTAWLKAHWPAELGCALLDDYGGHYPLRVIAGELLRRGVRILPPSVDRSEARCTMESTDGGERAIRVGLERIPIVSARTRAAILARRASAGAFRDLTDFLADVRPPARELEALVLCGACDHLAPLSRDGFPWVHRAVLASAAAGVRGHALARAAASPPDAPADARGSEWRTWRELARAREELRFLQMSVSAHPLALLRGEAERAGCITTRDARARTGERVRLAVLLAASRRVSTARGPVRFLTLEDEHGLLEGVLTGSAHRAHDAGITTPGPYLVVGRVRDDRGAVSLVLEELAPFHRRREAAARGRRPPRDAPRDVDERLRRADASTRAGDGVARDDA